MVFEKKASGAFNWNDRDICILYSISGNYSYFAMLPFLLSPSHFFNKKAFLELLNFFGLWQKKNEKIQKIDERGTINKHENKKHIGCIFMNIFILATFFILKLHVCCQRGSTDICRHYFSFLYRGNVS